MVNSNRSAKWDFGGRVHHRPADDERHARPHLRAARQGDRPRRARPGAAAAATRGDAPVPRLLRRARREWRLHAAGPLAAMPRSPAPTPRPARPLPPLTLAELMSNRAAGLPLVFEEFFDQQTPMMQPVGGMDRIAHALYEQVRPAVRLNSPITAIRRQGAGVQDRIWAGQPGARRRLLHLHAAAEPAGPDPERFLAGQAGGDPRHPLSAERSRSASKARASGRKKGFTAASAGPTSPTRI